MKRWISVSVIYPQPQIFRIEIDDEKSINEIRKDIKKTADYYMETSPTNPVIVDCDDEKFIEQKQKA